MDALMEVLYLLQTQTLDATTIQERKTELAILTASGLIDEQAQITEAGHELLAHLLDLRAKQARIIRSEVDTQDATGRMTLFATCTGLTATSIAPFGGMTNQNYLVTTVEGNFILRIAGAKTECFISRSAEGYNGLLAYLLGLNVYPYFFETQTGIKITKFVEGSYTLQPEQLRKDRLSEVAALLQQLHHCPYPLQGDFKLLEEFKKYEAIVGSDQEAYYQGYLEAKQWVITWMEIHGVDKLPCVACHNDLVLENLLVGEKLMLIDWEYAGNNHAAFDLASFVREADLTLSQQALFLEAYYGRVATSEEQDLVRFYGIAQDVLWSVWSMAKTLGGEDHTSYGQARLARAMEEISNWK